MLLAPGKTVDLSLKSADSGILTLGSIFSSQSAFVFFFFFDPTFVMHKGLATFRNEAPWMYSKLTAVHLLQIAILYSYEILVFRITLTLTIAVFPEWVRVKWIYLVCRMFSTFTHKNPVNIKCNIVAL